MMLLSEHQMLSPYVCVTLDAVLLAARELKIVAHDTNGRPQITDRNEAGGSQVHISSDDASPNSHASGYTTQGGSKQKEWP